MKKDNSGNVLGILAVVGLGYLFLKNRNNPPLTILPNEPAAPVQSGNIVQQIQTGVNKALDNLVDLINPAPSYIVLPDDYVEPAPMIVVTQETTQDDPALVVERYNVTQLVETPAQPFVDELVKPMVPQVYVDLQEKISEQQAPAQVILRDADGNVYDFDAQARADAERTEAQYEQYDNSLIMGIDEMMY